MMTSALRLVVSCRGATYEGGRTLAEARDFARTISAIKPGSPVAIQYVIPGSRGEKRQIETWLTGKATSER